MILSNLFYYNFSIPILSPPNPNFLISRTPPRFLLHCRRSGSTDWDWNAESFRFKFRDEEEENEEFDDDFEMFDEESDDIWDKIWIFKVFKAYGYMLPFIIASFLLATGPKAFLMALAIPLGQSAISLAFENLYGRVSKRPRSKPKAKKKNLFARNPSKSSSKWKEMAERRSNYNGRYGYKSWVFTTDLSEKNNMESGSRNSSFGGWDELDNQMEASRRQSPIQSKNVKKDNMSERGRNRDEPLLLRLLIAVFPFLSSWTKML